MVRRSVKPQQPPACVAVSQKRTQKPTLPSWHAEQMMWPEEKELRATNHLTRYRCLTPPSVPELQISCWRCCLMLCFGQVLITSIKFQAKCEPHLFCASEGDCGLACRFISPEPDLQSKHGHTVRELGREFTQFMPQLQ